MTQRALSPIGLVLLAAVFALPAFAAVLEVDASGGTPYTTIQAAIDAAAPGSDSVLVRCGSYTENLVLRDEVSVSGEQAGCVTVDGGQTGPVVTAIGVGPTTVLEELTLRNGLADFGGGIYLEDSATVVRRNLILDNATTLFGGGGGIFVTGDYFSMAGAVSPTITRNVIARNRADDTGGGIAFYADTGTDLTNNVVVQNDARTAGGGIDIFFSSPVMTNNTIADNCKDATLSCDSGGGGIRILDSSNVESYNNLVAFNEADFGGGGLEVANSTLTYHANDAFGNLPVNYVGIADPTGADGNIAFHPLFDTTGTYFDGYRPRSHTFILDAATGGTPPSDDIRGKLRPRDGDADGVAVHDIGAHEVVTMTRFRFASDGLTVFWDPGVDTPDYNLYRGDLQVLRDTGIYTQDLMTVDGAQQWCGLTMANRLDIDSPDPNQGYFYLSVSDEIVEGSLGLDSAGNERPFMPAFSCP